MTAANVPCGPVNSIAEALEDPQAAARGVVQPLEHPRLGTINHIASPIRLSPGGTRAMAPAPERGADNAALLGDAAERRRRRTVGAFRNMPPQPAE